MSLRNADQPLIDILAALNRGDWDYYYPYSYLESETKLPRSELKKYIDILKKLGYVKYARGLMNDDGEVAGSGFGINHDKRAEIEAVLELREHEVTKDLITLNGVDYQRVGRTLPQVNVENSYEPTLVKDQYGNAFMLMSAYEANAVMLTLQRLAKDVKPGYNTGDWFTDLPARIEKWLNK